VKVVRNRRNTGLARANNLGASFCTAPNLFFLNPDVVLHPGAITTLLEFAASNPGAGLIGPGMVDTGGSRQSSARTFPTPLDLLLRRTLLGRLPLSRQRLDRHLNPVSGERPSRADWLVGAALFCTEAGRRRFGLMSNRYFLYFEDVEWCWRAWAAGMEVWHHPGAVITHVCRRESARLAGRAAWLHFVSMLRFYSEHPAAMGGRRPGKG
jgi:hypothetical protein